MIEDDWREESIGRQHDRTAFDCGVMALNQFLHRFARQNHVGGGAKTFAAAPRSDPARVLAYYTIGPSSLDVRIVPLAIAKGRGSYELPVFRLARLAVSRPFQAQQLGSRMLFAAARRAIAAASFVGGMALAIDAKNAAAALWYQRFGAVPLIDLPLNLILPFSVIARSVEIADGETRLDR